MRRSRVHYITALGLMIALVFVGNHISIKVPITIGDSSARIHFGNIFCLFGAYIFGPVGGGLAAGLGGVLYDVTSDYITSAPFTFAFKFVMGFVCGKIAYMGKNKGTDTKLNIIGGILGIVAYMVLYLSRSFIRDVYFNMMEMTPALLNLSTRAISSTVNGVIAVAVAVPLGLVIRKALEANNLMDAIRGGSK